ncbi:TraR/DksA family transcriptional regulator [Paractinoplanes globisporus]|uniref:TraR/DksA family transcriptional regulator n=1 Tax=Paractinoplanes globisporus TaxID=113565 RepID=A0ABW6W6Y8_9ACTN|nr:TraR/DksA C4-type zinc finger protein [Actinoplanes globisporus]
MTTQAAPSSPTVDATFARPVHPTTPIRATPIRARRSDLAPPMLADMQRDAVALTWDLTVHQLHQAFADSLATPSTELLDAAGSQELARTRLAAARHAIDDIQAALGRMARGTYGRCQQCGQRITADRLQASPTARWCAACQGQPAEVSRTPPRGVTVLSSPQK